MPGYEVSVWNGIVVPKSTPSEIIDKLNGADKRGACRPEVENTFRRIRRRANADDARGFGKLIVVETEKWAKVIRAANIKPE